MAVIQVILSNNVKVEILVDYFAKLKKSIFTHDLDGRFPGS